MYSRVHIIGIGGTLMGHFAVFLKQSGVRVTGSDGVIYPPMSHVLRDVAINQGYDPSHIPHDTECVIIGNVIRATNPEALEAFARMKQGLLRVMSLPEMLEEQVLTKTHNICVAGTHGKTTTSGLLAYTLQRLEQAPSYLIGGVCLDLDVSFKIAGPYFVLEADEYDTAFWDKVPKFFHYRPTSVLLLALEFDHADIYKDLAAVEEAFYGLLERMPEHGVLVANTMSPSVLKLLGRLKKPLRRHLLHGDETYLTDVQDRDGLLHCTFMDRGVTDTFTLRIPGRHNAENALAAWVLLGALGFDKNLVREAFASFRGIARRQEVRLQTKDYVLIDDFAHHPTAVKETLRALRARFPSRMVVLFEPRSASSRRRVFQRAYEEAFGSADCVFIAEPFDHAEDRFSSAELVAALPCSYVLPSAGRVEFVMEHIRPGDTIVVLSNGAFGGIVTELEQRLSLLQVS